MMLVTFALPDEGRAFAQLAVRQKVPVRILHTGIGVERARASLRASLDAEPPPRLIISSGFAGALDPALRVGDLVIATNFTTAPLPDLAAHRGAFTTQPRLIESPAEKRRLAAETGALAVEMETAALAAECAARGIPLLALRVISDAAGQSMPVPYAVWFDEARQRARPLALAGWLLRHPFAIPAFIRFVRGIFRCQKILAHTLLGVVKELV